MTTGKFKARFSRTQFLRSVFLLEHQQKDVIVDEASKEEDAGESVKHPGLSKAPFKTKICCARMLIRVTPFIRLFRKVVFMK